MPTSSPTAPLSGTCTEVLHIDYSGHDLDNGRVLTDNAAACAEACIARLDCTHFTFAVAFAGCYLKSSGEGERSVHPSLNAVSGECGRPTTKNPTLAPTPAQSACKEIQPSGCCRTISNHFGQYELISTRTIRECEENCTEQQACVGYEYEASSSTCELHTVAINHTATAATVPACAEEQCFSCLPTPTTNSPTGAPTTIFPRLVLIRPFFDGDFDILMESFAAWFGSGMPCATNGGIPDLGTIDMILYYSRNSSSVSSTIQTAVEAINGSSAVWRQCIGSITLLTANLTEVEDVYDRTAGTVDWNRGPNLQFYRVAEWIQQNNDYDMFFYMEGDTIPVAAGWLDALRVDIAQNQPFAILGSRYSGHNWDPYLGHTPPIIPDSLAFHLNGNAVYNTTHKFVQDVVASETSALLKSVPFSSFDVRFCEVALHQLAYNATALPHLGYKQSTVLANFASTLVLPNRIPTPVQLVHGARNVHRWVDRASDVELDANISLVISDWAEENDVSHFMTSLDSTDLQVSFAEVVLITQDGASATEAESAHSQLSATGRNWSKGGAEWDLCSANVSTSWFVIVNTHYRVATTLELPTSYIGYKPLVPYKRRDSIYCDCVCKARIDEAATLMSNFSYDIAPEHAVLHTATRNAYCAVVQSLSGAVPSVNGYFAYVLSNASLHDENMYQFYDRERYGVISAFIPPAGAQSQCSTPGLAPAPCIFPFSYRNVSYSQCTVEGTSAAYGIGHMTDDGGRAFRASGANLPWCATTLTATGEVENWRYCRNDIVSYVPENAGVRVRERRQGVSCSQVGGSFTCTPTSVPSSTPTARPTATFAPVTPAPTTLAPRTFEPTSFAPTSLAPSSSTVRTVAPTTVAPTTTAPTTPQPHTFSPTTVAPTTLAPTTISPVYAPTIADRQRRQAPPGQSYAPTTLAPTTTAPTDAQPLGANSPTSLAPVTFAPVTTSPTETTAPISFAPTTLAPTGSLPPNTFAPTTISPTTIAPTEESTTTIMSTSTVDTTVRSQGQNVENHEGLGTSLIVVCVVGGMLVVVGVVFLFCRTADYEYDAPSIEAGVFEATETSAKEDVYTTGSTNTLLGENTRGPLFQPAGSVMGLPPVDPGRVSRTLFERQSTLSENSAAQPARNVEWEWDLYFENK